MVFLAAKLLKIDVGVVGELLPGAVRIFQILARNLDWVDHRGVSIHLIRLFWRVPIQSLVEATYNKIIDFGLIRRIQRLKCWTRHHSSFRYLSFYLPALLKHSLLLACLILVEWTINVLAFDWEFERIFCGRIAGWSSSIIWQNFMGVENFGLFGEVHVFDWIAFLVACWTIHLHHLLTLFLGVVAADRWV